MSREHVSFPGLTKSRNPDHLKSVLFIFEVSQRELRLVWVACEVDINDFRSLKLQPVKFKYMYLSNLPFLKYLLRVFLRLILLNGLYLGISYRRPIETPNEMSDKIRPSAYA